MKDSHTAGGAGVVGSSCTGGENIHAVSTLCPLPGCLPFCLDINQLAVHKVH